MLLCVKWQHLQMQMWVLNYMQVLFETALSSQLQTSTSPATKELEAAFVQEAPLNCKPVSAFAPFHDEKSRKLVSSGFQSRRSHCTILHHLPSLFFQFAESLPTERRTMYTPFLWPAAYHKFGIVFG